MSEFFDDIFYTTVLIQTRTAGPDPVESIGTGFLYRQQVPGNDRRSVTMLVSNRHVFLAQSGTMRLVFHSGENATKHNRWGDRRH